MFFLSSFTVPQWIKDPSSRVWIGFGVLALLLRCVGMDSEPLWLDELNSLMVATVHGYPNHLPTSPLTAQQWLTHHVAWQPLWTAIGWKTLLAMLKDNVHLPLYYALLNPWLAVWKSLAPQLPAYSEWPLRSFSLVWGLILLLPLGALLQTTEKTESFHPHRLAWGLLLVAINPFLLTLSQEGRMYTLSMALCACSGLALYQLAVHPKNSPSASYWWWIYGLSTALGLMSHYVFWLQGVFHAGVWAWAWNQQRLHKASAPPLNLKAFLTVCTLLILVLACWKPMFDIQHTGALSHGDLTQEDHFADGLLSPIRYVSMLFWEPWMLMSGTALWAKMVYIPLCTVSLLSALWAWVKGRLSPLVGYCLLWAYVPLLTQIAVDALQGTHTSTIIRYGLLMFPPLLVIVAHALAQWQTHPQHGYQRGVLALLLMLVGGLTVWPGSPAHFTAKYPARALTQTLTQHLTPTHPSLLVVNGPLAAPVTAAWYLAPFKPHVPILYWVKTYRSHPRVLPNPSFWKAYPRVFVMRIRGTSQRGWDELVATLNAHYPHRRSLGTDGRLLVWEKAPPL
ncbi:MAG: hypothetical protein U0003_03370 [Vampirovibrionales bacterium]